MSKAGEIIKHCRDSSGMTQADLSRLTGITRATIAGWETRPTEPPFSKFEKAINAAGYRVMIVSKAKAIRNETVLEALKQWRKDRIRNGNCSYDDMEALGAFINRMEER